MELLKSFSFDEQILPNILKERERYSGKRSEEKYDPSSIKKQLNAHIVGEEKDNTVLVAWSDSSPTGTGGRKVTYIGLYESSRDNFRLLFIHDKKAEVVGASVNQERTLLAFTITEPYYAALEDPSSSNFPGIYKSFLAEIRPQNRIFSLYIEKQNYQRVQFLYGDYQGYGSSSKKESHMLFLHHREAIGLYHIPMARIGDKGMIMSSQPRTEQVAKSFVWAQWDIQQQRLYCAYEDHKQDLEEVEDDDVDVPLMFAAYQFSEKSSHVRVLNVVLPFERTYLTHLGTSYLNHSLTQSISEKHFNMQVVTLAGGSLFVCLQHPYTRSDGALLPEDVPGPAEGLDTKVDLEYSVFMLHHGRVLHCVLPGIIHQLNVENCRIFFSSLNDYIVVLLPGYFLHLLDCGAEHGPCHHIVLQDYAISMFQYSKTATSSEPTTLFYMNKEQTTSVTTGPCVFNASSGDAFKYSFDKKALVELFSRTHLPSTRSALLHMALVHLRETNMAKKMIQHLCHDPASPECSGILKEYLVASTYGQIKRELDKDTHRLMPITCEEMFRGHLEKDVNRKRIARITLASCKDSQMEFQHVKSDRKKEADFWTALVNNTTKPSPRFSFSSLPQFDNENADDELEVVDASVQSRPGSVRALLRRLSRKTPSSESVSSPDRCTPDFLETPVHVDLEKSSTEIKKQNAIVEQLRVHLQNHLPREPKAKMHNIAVEFVNFQCEQSRSLLRIFWSAFGFNAESNPNTIPLSCRGTVRDVALFQMVERYYTAVMDLRFPFPSGFETFYTALGFRCLEHRMFLQYVDSGVLQLTKGFVNRLIEDMGGESNCSEIVFQVINRLTHASAKKALQKWERHPAAARYLSRSVVNELLAADFQTGERETVDGTRERPAAHLQSSSGSCSDIEINTFRPLATLMAVLRTNRMSVPAERMHAVQPEDLSFVEANALTEIRRQINGSLGSVPF